jgi:tetratricopeptide (TPR) repeat protein
MKIVITLTLILFALTVRCQEYAFASSQTDITHGLYKKANESLTLGNKKMAIAMFEEVAEFFEQEGRLKELPENYLGMALSLALTGHYAESVRYHKKALRAHRRYRAAEPADEIIINLSLVYQLAGKGQKSKRYLHKHKIS